MVRALIPIQYGLKTPIKLFSFLYTPRQEKKNPQKKIKYVPVLPVQTMTRLKRDVKEKLEVVGKLIVCS